MKVNILAIKIVNAVRFHSLVIYTVFTYARSLLRDLEPAALLVHLKCLESFQRMQICINNGLLLATFCLDFLGCSSSVNMKVFMVYQQNTFTPHISASK